MGALVEYGISEEEAHVYAESIRRGGTLVSVRADDKADEAEMIMRRHNPVDFNDSRGIYRGEGWISYDSNPAADRNAEQAADRDRRRAVR